MSGQHNSDGEDVNPYETCEQSTVDAPPAVRSREVEALGITAFAFALMQPFLLHWQLKYTLAAMNDARASASDVASIQPQPIISNQDMASGLFWIQLVTFILAFVFSIVSILRWKQKRRFRRLGVIAISLQALFVTLIGALVIMIRK